MDNTREPAGHLSAIIGIGLLLIGLELLSRQWAIGTITLAGPTSNRTFENAEPAPRSLLNVA